MGAEHRQIGGRYRILTQVGEGGMSQVYLAMDSSLNKQWAIKEIHKSSEPVKRDLMMKSLTIEANMIKRLDHPAIPRIVDLIEEGNSLFVVMDYVEGQTLSQLLQSEGIQSEEDVVAWGVQLCDVLDYLHRHKPSIVFRDMKPSNVMLNPEGNIKLIDFGIALEVDHHGKPLVGDGRQLGTFGFGAPEQFAEDVRVDARTDVYALGATLFYLLTGVHPRRNGVVPLRQVNPNFSEGLERVIVKATRENPSERYQNCAEMAYALQHYQESDEAHRKSLTFRWRWFLGVIIGSAGCLLLSGCSMLLANHVRDSDYGYWMQQAAQNTDDDVAVPLYIKAASIKKDAVEPYEHLIRRFTADGRFDDKEEKNIRNLDFGECGEPAEG